MSATNSVMPEPEIPLACDLNAIDPANRSKHLSRAGYLLSDIAQEHQETPEGFTFRFTAEDYPLIVEFIANERLCCPFFHFVLEVPPGQGPIRLHLTGGEAAKAFLRAELSLR